MLRTLYNEEHELFRDQIIDFAVRLKEENPNGIVELEL